MNVLRVSNSTSDKWNELAVEVVYITILSVGRFGAVWKGAKTTEIILGETTRPES